LKQFAKRQAVADPTAAKRKREQRERERQEAEASRVTNRDVPSRHVERETEEKERLEENLYTADFEKFRSVYPKRAGSDDNKAAFKHWGARLKDGHTEADIIAGAERYAAFIKHTGKANTEFVMQSATFLGPSDPPRFKEAWRAPGQPAPVTDAKPMPCDESLQPYADRLISAFGVPYYNSWIVQCTLVEKEDWLTLAAPTKWMAGEIQKTGLSKLKKIFGDQFQVGHGRPKVDA
jgi:hypothetical protein